MNVQVFKLITGEEVIARVVTQPNEEYVGLDRARVISMMPTQNGQLGIALMPLSINAIDAVFFIHSGAIIGHPAKVNIDLEKRYLSETSGIQLTP